MRNIANCKSLFGRVSEANKWCPLNSGNALEFGPILFHRSIA